jgi:hypothetical protein
MASRTAHNLLEVGKQFQIYGEFQQAAPYGNGHINDTYVALYSQAGAPVRFVHQRINHEVFQDPVGLMENVIRVTAHLRAKLTGAQTNDVTRRVLTLVPARDGLYYYQDQQKNYWRTYLYIEKVRTFDAVRTPGQAYEAGKAFGQFQSALADLPGRRLVETIPNFHHSALRFEALERAIESDSCNRAQKASAQIDFAAKRKSLVNVLLKGRQCGEIPERVTHNDTKFNNVMLDETSQRALCVVDLDTVMPGLVHYDFGDMVRTTTSPTTEDEQDLTKIEMQMSMFEALARGYLEAADDMLTKGERAKLGIAGQLITFTIGIRFLTDYLRGDTYFKVRRPSHNLERCAAQFRLLESLEKHEEKMQSVIDSF